MLGRTVRREYADSAEEICEFNNLGQLVAHRDADDVTRRFAYNNDRDYDAIPRLRHVATEAGYGATYLFDTAGRFSGISDGRHWADIGYESGTTIFDSTAIRRVRTLRLERERSTNKLGRSGG